MKLSSNNLNVAVLAPPGFVGSPFFGSTKDASDVSALPEGSFFVLKQEVWSVIPVSYEL
jgi:hypothetical protein